MKVDRREKRKGYTTQTGETERIKETEAGDKTGSNVMQNKQERQVKNSRVEYIDW